MKFFITRFLNKIQKIYFYPAIYKSKQFYKACFCTAFIFFLSCSIPSSSAEENVEDIIILFDQSASMKEYDPKSISKTWLITFIKTFKKPYNVLLVGFDDRIHQHTKVTMKNKKDVQTLRDKIKRIETHGVTTDMEAPLRYLLEREKKHPIAFAVIVSDGEQEIWDEKRWYLSKRIRTDNRYEDLNKQYRSLKAEGVTFKQIYNRLKGLYHARNLNLINDRLAKLKEKIGGKLVFLDISGDFKFFKKWAEAANARYILANARGEEDPVKALRNAIIVLQERASDILQEQLPSDHAERVEPTPEPQEDAEIPVFEPSPEPELPAVKPPAVSDKELPPFTLQEKESDVPPEQLPSDHAERVEPTPKPQEDAEIPVFEPSPERQVIEEPAPVTSSVPETPVKPPAAADKELPSLKIDLKETDKKDLPKRRMIFMTIIILLIVAFFSAVLFRYRKKAKLAPEEFEGTKDEIYKNKTPEQANVKLKNLSLRSIKDTNKFIENEIQTAINDAGKEQGKLLNDEKDRFRLDKRSFLRIPVPTGAMIVHWINKNGERHQGNATNISMNEVMFEAADFSDGSIDTIECPDIDITFHVKQSRIIRKEGIQVVAALDEFRYNIDDRIKWVETLTRIEEEVQ